MNLQTKVLIEAYERGYRVNKNGIVYKPDGTIQKLYISSEKSSGSKKGYLVFTLKYKNYISRKVYIHRLQAFQKFGSKIFEKGIQVRHLDNDSHNNKISNISNISIGSQSENFNDNDVEFKKKFIRKGRKAASKVNRKFTDEEIEEIRKDYSNLKSYKKVMDKWKITSKGTLYYILKHNYAAVA